MHDLHSFCPKASLPDASSPGLTLGSPRLLAPWSMWIKEREINRSGFFLSVLHYAHNVVCLHVALLAIIASFTTNRFCL